MIESHNKGTLLEIQVKPRSKKQAIIFDGETSCTVFVKAAPVRGQANKEMVKLVANTLGIPTHRVRIIHGEKVTTKRLLIEGLDPQSVLDGLKAI